MTKEEAIFCEKSYIGETNCTDCKYYGTETCQSRESHKMAIKALEQQINDCKIFGTKENCFGGATEYECNHCDYKIQKEKSLAFLDGCIAGFKGADKIAKEQSEDCISRQAAIRLAEQGQVQGFEWQIRKLVTLPPITPTQDTFIQSLKECKQGEWIKDGFNIKCSNCNNLAPTRDRYYWDKTNFCPNCGARMIKG